MKTQIAVVMVGENIFGRMLLEEFLQEGISPLVVINEAGSKRSKEFKMLTIMILISLEGLRILWVDWDVKRSRYLMCKVFLRWKLLREFHPITS